MNKLIFLLLPVILLSFKNPENSKSRWYKGNTHCHSTMSDGDSAPFKVIQAYHDQGYNFLLLTDHNVLVDPDTIQKPENMREDFLLIPGEEVTDRKSVHTTAFNVKEYVPFYNDRNEADNPSDRKKEIRAALQSPSDVSKTDLVQLHVDRINKAGGTPFLNHPNFSGGLQVSDIMPVNDLAFLELYNGHPSVANWGKEGHIPVEAKWDSLLSSGMKIYGVAADDMHHLGTGNPKKAGLFRGWIMVKSKSLTTKAIHKSILKGDFYATTSVILEKCIINSKECSIEVDIEATEKEVISSDGQPRIDDTGDEGFTIEFIGDHGQVLSKTLGTRASFKPMDQNKYVRARITWCKKTAKGYEKLFAWSQPVFL